MNVTITKSLSACRFVRRMKNYILISSFISVNVFCTYAQNKPNVLFLQTDQHVWYALGFINSEFETYVIVLKRSNVSWAVPASLAASR